MKWTELLAAGTVAWFAWNYFTSNNGTQSSPYARPIDDPVIRAKIAAVKPYRDYSDVVQRIGAGTWYGGL